MEDLQTYRSRVGLFTHRLVNKENKCQTCKQAAYGKRDTEWKRTKHRRKNPRTCATGQRSSDGEYVERRHLVDIIGIRYPPPTCVIAMLFILFMLMSLSITSVHLARPILDYDSIFRGRFIETPSHPGRLLFVNRTCDYLLGNAGVHSYNGNPRTHEEIEHLKTKVKRKHAEMVRDLATFIGPDLREIWSDFQTLMEPYLPHAEIYGDNVAHISHVISALLDKGHIKLGQYDTLSQAVSPLDVRAGDVIANATSAINDMDERLRTKDNNPKRAAMIETTTALVEENTAHPFLETRAFRDAKDKLLKNKVIIIRGNTGSGKTSIALRLLSLMSRSGEKRQRQGKRPIEVDVIESLKEIVQPMLNLAGFVDDIFGKEIVSQKHYGAWKEREQSMLASLSGDINEDSNILVITIGTNVFNSLNLSLTDIFSESNIIDLDSNCYKSDEEQMDLLDLYMPKTKDFIEFTKHEKEEIVKSSADVGFPQRCRLFRDSSRLQKERVHFFHMPFHCITEILSTLRDGQCVALLLLFLNEGKMKVKELYDYIDKSKIEAAFDYDETIADLSDRQKVRFVEERLEDMMGWLVTRRTFWWGGSEMHYIFTHDSIHKSMALLYGKKSPMCYIKNCPFTFLGYITTSDSTTNRIVISPNDEHMYTRLLSEFESEYTCSWWPDLDYDNVLALDILFESGFLKGFISWLNKQHIDSNLSTGIKQTFVSLLNRACSSRAEDRVLCLLSEGVKPDNKTAFAVVEGGSVKLLRVILQCDVIQTARANWSQSSYDAWDINILHEACLFEREEMITMLVDAFPVLLDQRDRYGHSTIHLVAMTGNCSVYDAVESRMLGSRNRQQQLCQLVDVEERTILHESCFRGHTDLSLSLCEKYPDLLGCRDRYGWHCLHFIARWTSDVDFFTKFESFVKTYEKSKGHNYDIKTILTEWEGSVLDWANRGNTDNNPLYDHLVQIWSKDVTHDAQ